jgi:hypothetical protein
VYQNFKMQLLLVFCTTTGIQAAFVVRSMQPEMWPAALSDAEVLVDEVRPAPSDQAESPSNVPEAAACMVS